MTYDPPASIAAKTFAGPGSPRRPAGKGRTDGRADPRRSVTPRRSPTKPDAMGIDIPTTRTLPARRSSRPRPMRGGEAIIWRVEWG